MIDRAPQREVLRHIAPLAAGAHHVEHRVEQFPIGMLPRATRFAGLGKTIMDELPFGVSEIRSVSHPQPAGVSRYKSTAKSSDLSDIFEFSNRLLGHSLSVPVFRVKLF